MKKQVDASSYTISRDTTAMAVITALAASARGRSPFAWFVWGALFSVFALLAVLVMENKKFGPGS